MEGRIELFHVQFFPKSIQFDKNMNKEVFLKFMLEQSSLMDVASFTITSNTTNFSFDTGVEVLSRNDCFQTFKKSPLYIFIMNSQSKKICGSALDLSPLYVDAFRQSFEYQCVNKKLYLENAYRDIVGSINVTVTIRHIPFMQNEVKCMDQTLNDTSHSKSTRSTVDLSNIFTMTSTQMRSKMKKSQHTQRDIINYPDLLKMFKNYQSLTNECIEQIDDVGEQVDIALLEKHINRMKKYQKLRKEKDPLQPANKVEDLQEIDSSLIEFSSEVSYDDDEAYAKELLAQVRRELGIRVPNYKPIRTRKEQSGNQEAPKPTRQKELDITKKDSPKKERHPSQIKTDVLNHLNKRAEPKAEKPPEPKKPSKPTTHRLVDLAVKKPEPKPVQREPLVMPPPRKPNTARSPIILKTVKTVRPPPKEDNEKKKVAKTTKPKELKPPKPVSDRLSPTKPKPVVQKEEPKETPQKKPSAKRPKQMSQTKKPVETKPNLLKNNKSHTQEELLRVKPKDESAKTVKRPKPQLTPSQPPVSKNKKAETVKPPVKEEKKLDKKAKTTNKIKEEKKKSDDDNISIAESIDLGETNNSFDKTTSVIDNTTTTKEDSSDGFSSGDSFNSETEKDPMEQVVVIEHSKEETIIDDTDKKSDSFETLEDSASTVKEGTTETKKSSSDGFESIADTTTSAIKDSTTKTKKSSVESESKFDSFEDAASTIKESTTTTKKSEISDDTFDTIEDDTASAIKESTTKTKKSSSESGFTSFEDAASAIKESTAEMKKSSSEAESKFDSFEDAASTIKESTTATKKSSSESGFTSFDDTASAIKEEKPAKKKSSSESGFTSLLEDTTSAVKEASKVKESSSPLEISSGIKIESSSSSLGPPLQMPDAEQSKSKSKISDVDTTDFSDSGLDSLLASTDSKKKEDTSFDIDSGFKNSPENSATGRALSSGSSGINDDFLDGAKDDLFSTLTKEKEKELDEDIKDGELNLSLLNTENIINKSKGVGSSNMSSILSDSEI